ncbi:MAG: fumarylacetoacetate hydrolase family protein [Acidimicrobiales bacterium]
MKLATIRTPSGTRAVRLEGDRVVEIGSSDVGSLMAGSLDWLDRARQAEGPDHQTERVSFAQPVLWPSKVICLGLNYEAHIGEMGHNRPQYPTLFAKFPDSLTGPNDPIVLPSESIQVDWEVELVLVVGRLARRVGTEEALGYIGGLTVANDVSMRDFQHRTAQFLQGKIFESSTPVGPVVVTPEEVNWGLDLEITSEVDGEVMQLARTSDMIFGPAEIVSYVSNIIMLRPGDLILTGTPSGVGAGRDPQVFLRPGNSVRCSIYGIGALNNTFVADLA